MISTKLLSAEDKEDMRNGNLTMEQLILHVKVWRDNRMPDYVENPK